MAPRTRRSYTKGDTESARGPEDENQVSFGGSTIADTSAIIAQRVIPEKQSQILQPVRGKRTFSQVQAPSDTHIPASSVQVNPTKKLRSFGPIRSRPMPLILPSESDVENCFVASKESEMENQQNRDDGNVTKGKGRYTRTKLERTSSFYPGRGNNSHLDSPLSSHVLARLDNHTLHAPQVDDDGFGTDEDFIDDNDAVELALKLPTKFSESLAIERPSWVASGGSEPDHSASQSSRASMEDTTGPFPSMQCRPDTAVPALGLPIVAAALPLESTSDSNSPQAAWPAETDLVFAIGSNKLMLTGQRPLVRAVIQDAIENLRAALLFNNAFPDVCLAFTLIKDSLLTSANRLKPGAKNILDRLERDEDYLLKITPLPRARICLIRSEVKERCNIITMGSFLAFGSALQVVEYVRSQLSQYTYSFPRAHPGNTSNGLVMRTRPYRNPRIITAIRDMYFSGGATSFARRFSYLFPTYESREGEVNCEVPAPMVALVATALYATIYEWRTGEQQIAEFSANAYLDVYQGHMNTLKHIREKREGAFHIMMTDIYTKASMHPGNEMNVTVPIAELDLDNLED